MRQPSCQHQYLNNKLASFYRSTTVSRPASASYKPQPPACPASPLRICTFVFNYFHDAPPATSFFSNFCIVARGCVPSSSRLLATHHRFALFALSQLFSFHTNTNCPFCNPFVLITIRIAPGVGGLSPLRDLKFYLNFLLRCAGSPTAAFGDVASAPKLLTVSCRLSVSPSSLVYNVRLGDS